jgi:hypothetical protein
MTDSIRPSSPQDPARQSVEETDAERRARLARLDRDAADEGEPGAGDVSPHHGGRAQPGDILGIETGGETTTIGDTPEDENERRRKAEKDAPR